MARYWFVLLAIVLAAVTSTTAQDTTARLFHNFTVVPNITYLTASNYESKLDLYVTRTPERPLPTLIYIHGGGWVAETKELRNLEVLPYLEMGMNVVNVDYRLAKIAHAPAAVEDARCALRWDPCPSGLFGNLPKRKSKVIVLDGAHHPRVFLVLAPKSSYLLIV